MSIILAALVLLFPFLYKYSYVITNQYSQLPIIYSFMDPGYLSRDWYVSLSRDFGPRTIFAWYMAQTAKIISLPTSFYLHYLIYIFFIVIATYKLSLLIIKNKHVALLTTISILFSSSITLGGNILVTQDFSAPQLPLSLTLMGIYFLFTNKFLAASILFSIGSFLHPLIGLESAGIFFMIFAWLSHKQNKLKALILQGVLPFIILISPLLYLYVTSYQIDNTDKVIKINILAYMRNPHHFVASSFSFFQYFNFFVLISIVLLILHKYKNLFEYKFTQTSKLLIASVLSLCFLGFLGIEVFGIYPLTLLQPFRLTLYVFWLGSIIIFSFIFYYVEKYQSLLSNWLLIIPLFYTKLVTLQTVGKIEILAFLLGGLLILFNNKLPKKLFVILLIFYFSLFQYHDKFNFNSFYRYETEETQLAQWAKQNTPQDSIFLIPPDMETFRLIAQRGIVIDWKAFPFQERAMLEWANRICEIGNIPSCNFRNTTTEKVTSGYRTLESNQIMKLSDKYGFKYFISDKYYPELRYIYKNGYYIYETATQPN